MSKRHGLLYRLEITAMTNASDEQERNQAIAKAYALLIRWGKERLKRKAKEANELVDDKMGHDGNGR